MHLNCVVTEYFIQYFITILFNIQTKYSALDKSVCFGLGFLHCKNTEHFNEELDLYEIQVDKAYPVECLSVYVF